MRSALLALALAVTSASFAQSRDPNAGETKAHRDARMKWWREARFGMFIHWGLYAELEGEYKGVRTPNIGEWIMHDEKIPVADYAELAKKFNPVQFNADQWVGIAKAAGMKYIVMTAKHHEGFAMFHTATDGYNIFDATPFHRDPIAEMAAACKKQGIKFGVYYSQAQDWHHAGGAAYGGHWDPAQDGDLHEYVRKIAAPQVRELLTKIKPAVLWWDTSVGMSTEDIDELTAAFDQDPGLIANNRLGNGVPGDTETPEQFIPATGYPGRDWETCMTINDTWGYKYFDTNFKSTSMLVRNLVDIASKGGNYLLNVGPEPTGLIPAPEVTRLKEVGIWLRANGKSIYGTSASPFKRLPFNGRATVKGDTLFVNVFEWPSGPLTLKWLKTGVKSARVVATGERLELGKDADGNVTLSAPKKLDPVSTAVEVTLDGPAVVDEPEVTIAPQADGSFQLKAVEAVLDGRELQVEGDGDDANLGYWGRVRDTASWTLQVPAERAGRFTVDMVYACSPDTPDSTFELQVDGKSSGVGGTVAGTAGWRDYHTVHLQGVLTLAAGKHVVKVVPKTKPHDDVMNLRRFVLVPVAR
ncbi:MAG TPA: alpha-L-fucosidase [Fimbriimonadaceae bacterium]|nr:alpha-L-fucosidase [Fimbriimonadaceae bacterium]